MTPGSRPAEPAVPLPPSPVTTISTVSQEHPLLTHDLRSLTVFVFVSARPGVTDLRFTLTNGAGGTASRAARYHVVVGARG